MIDGLFGALQRVDGISTISLRSCWQGSYTLNVGGNKTPKKPKIHFVPLIILTKVRNGDGLFVFFFRVSRLSVHSDGLSVLPKEINQVGVLQIPFPRLIL